MSSFEENFEPYRASDAHNEMDARFGWELRNNEVHHLQREREILRAAICQTLDANGHLADGEVCTLLALKKALRKVGSPWAGDELQRENNRAAGCVLIAMLNSSGPIYLHFPAVGKTVA